MATKRKRTSEQNTSAAPDARAGKPERRPTPRKRTDAPAKAPRPGKIERAADAGLPPKADASASTRMVRTRSASRSGAIASKPADPGASGPFEAADSQEARPRKRAADGKKHRRKWPFVVVGVVVALVLATAGLLAWDRWLRYDDAAEIQGEWQVHGTTGVVVIDGQSIKLTEDVTWSYTMDTGSKTLFYTFGNMEGQGRYRFSLDRSQLVITDGSGYTWLSTLFDDLSWMADQSLRALQGQKPEEVVASDTTIVVDRLSHDASALPRTGEAVAPEPADTPDTPEVVDAPETPDSADGSGVPETSEAPQAPEAGGGSADGGGAVPTDTADAGADVPSPGAAFGVSDRSA